MKYFLESCEYFLIFIYRMIFFFRKYSQFSLKKNVFIPFNLHFCINAIWKCKNIFFSYTFKKIFIREMSIICGSFFQICNIKYFHDIFWIPCNIVSPAMHINYARARSYYHSWFPPSILSSDQSWNNEYYSVCVRRAADIKYIANITERTASSFSTSRVYTA